MVLRRQNSETTDSCNPLTPSHETICVERERLAEEYRLFVERFSETVFALRKLRGEEFDRVYRASEIYRVASEQARIALVQHRKQHLC